VAIVIVNRLWGGRPRNRSSIFGPVKRILLSEAFRSVPGQYTIQGARRFFSLGMERSGREADEFVTDHKTCSGTAM
jgi:hypothetical protein